MTIRTVSERTSFFLNLFDVRDRSVVGYFLRVFPVLYIGAACLAALASLFFFDELSEERWMPESILGQIVALIFFAPYLETLLMLVVFKLLSLFVDGLVFKALASGLIWGIAHAWIHPISGFSATWSFFVLSMCYLSWFPVSPKTAFCLTTGLHMATNALSLFLLMLFE
jgi:hypothetical protein